MQPDELAYAGVTRQAALIRAGEVSSRELVELYLERIERLDPELNAFRSVLAERALADAGQADARRGAGDERPLLGVPIAVKDSEDVAGEPTAWGTAAHGGPAARDNELVARLRAAGAVIVGKTNLPELAIMGDTEGPAFGVTRNPWDSDRTPGGSSGGSARRGGRRPLRGGHGVRRRGLDPHPRLLLRPRGAQAAARPHPARAARRALVRPERGRLPHPHRGRHRAAARRHRAGRGLRGGGGRPAGDGCAWPCRSSRRGSPVWTRRSRTRCAAWPTRCARSGTRWSSATRPTGWRWLPASVLYLAGIAHDARSIARPERLQRRTRGFARLGRGVTGLVGWARRSAAEHSARINELFRDHDVLLTPTLAHTPARAAEWEGMGATRALLEMAQAYPFNGIWNLTGQPALSIPGPPASDGMPLGAQLVGPPDWGGPPALAGRPARGGAGLARAPRPGPVATGT